MCEQCVAIYEQIPQEVINAFEKHLDEARTLFSKITEDMKIFEMKRIEEDGSLIEPTEEEIKLAKYTRDIITFHYYLGWMTSLIDTEESPTPVCQQFWNMGLTHGIGYDYVMKHAVRN